MITLVYPQYKRAIMGTFQNMYLAAPCPPRPPPSGSSAAVPLRYVMYVIYSKRTHSMSYIVREHILGTAVAGPLRFVMYAIYSKRTHSMSYIVREHILCHI